MPAVPKSKTVETAELACDLKKEVKKGTFSISLSILSSIKIKKGISLNLSLHNILVNGKTDFNHSLDRGDPIISHPQYAAMYFLI